MQSTDFSTGYDFILKNKYGVYSRNELERQLREGCLTVKELGLVYDLNEIQINHILRRLGISFRNYSNGRVITAGITPFMHQVLIGTLLGDACMKGPKIYEVSHGISQADYLFHIAECLGPYISSLNLRVSGGRQVLSLWTHHHNDFKSYFERFYSKGKQKKYLTFESIKDLNEIGLAYWYMDDGKYCKYGAYLCVGDITENEGLLILRILKKKFGIDARFQIHDKRMGYHNIYIMANSRQKFFSLIEPYIIPSMLYKVNGSSYPRYFPAKEVLAEKHIRLCNAVGKPIGFTGDNDIKKLVDSKITIKSRQQVYAEKIRELIKLGLQVSHTAPYKEPSKEGA